MVSILLMYILGVVRSEVSGLKNDLGLGSSSANSNSNSDRDISVQDLEKARKEEKKR